MKSILFHWGSITIYSYGMAMALGFVLAVVVLLWRAPKMNISRAIVYDMAIWAILGGLIGARIFYVVSHGGEFQHHLLQILMLNRGGLVFYGGFIGGILALLIFSKRKHISFLKILDFMIPSLVLAHALGRIGCFMNGCCFGRPATCSWAVTFPPGSLPALHYGARHLIHPTQIYESLLLVALFFILLGLEKFKKFEGQTFLNYLLLYPALRFSMEFFRGDNPFFGPLSLYQWISLFFFTSSLFLSFILGRNVRRNR
ncbi:MAG: prolipoprotein diacylglyceryl transferase [Chlamydiae bacterium]|nr:prolipoprotein diacylglyceryl transferase [Chlamydiota bacterium]MBI3266119.1 prolipoprotein diacylglyceryl transferase [Chlamydiota bacterium]